MAGEDNKNGDQKRAISRQNKRKKITKKKRDRPQAAVKREGERKITI